MRIHRDERGQTIILVALSLPLLLGFIGIATDVGALFKDKRTMQTAADAAAIAGALNLNYGNDAATAAGKKASAANGYTDSSNGVTVNVVNGPTWPFSNYKGVTGYVEATVTKPESTIFLSIFGYPSVTVSVRSVAAANGPGAGSIYTLGPTGTTLSINGSLTVQGGGIIVDSSDNSAMLVTGGPVTAASIGIVGGCSNCSGAVSGIIPYSDPLAYLPQIAPGGSCTNTLDQTGGTAPPLSPGCYTTFNANGANITLNPGTYVINAAAGMNITNSNMSGAGVTFYVNSGGVTINNSTVNLSAPNDKSLPYNGILVYQSALDNTAASINGLSASTVDGIFYFPTTSITIINVIGGNLYTDFVAQAITVTPSMTFNDYASLPGVSSPLSSVVLVE